MPKYIHPTVRLQKQASEREREVRMSKLSADEAAGNYVSENDMMKLPISSSPSSPTSNGGKGSSGSSNRALLVKRIIRVTLLFVAATVGCFIISGFLLGSYYDYDLSSHQASTLSLSLSHVLFCVHPKACYFSS